MKSKNLKVSVIVIITTLTDLQDFLTGHEWFHTNSESTVDELLDFLEVDIPAFRCGYLKEHFLERLKSVDLTDYQKLRLQKIALGLCKNDTVRREFRRWVNLMRKNADRDFVIQLRDMLATSSQTRAAKLMLEEVLGSRKELAN